ncbi:aromatic acid exporter family protein [Bacillaceae bacterium W0354]
MFKIGYRTIKTAIGAPISMLIAQMIGLDNYISAAILTILCIKATRRRSFLSAWYRLYACLVAIIISATVFYLFGYTPVTFGLVLIIFIPITVKLNITEGIITSSVIILHLYGAGYVSLNLFVNEIILLMVGLGVALLLNLYMPSLEYELEQIQTKLESKFSTILKEIGLYLRTGDREWSGQELTEAAILIDKAKSLASRDVENHLLRSHHPFNHYFHMRERQLDNLEQMLPLISRLRVSEEEHEYIGKMFEELSDHVHPGNTAIKFLEQLKNIRDRFNKEPLPENKEQFEERANLYLLLNEIEQYLIIKRSYKKSDI